MNGLNRILNGDAWKKRNFKGRSFEDIPVLFVLRSSYKALSESSDIFKGISNSMYIDASLIYGDPFSCDGQSPYSYFSFKAGANLISDKQPLLSNVNAIGLIFGKEIELKKESGKMILGIFQHFDYYDSYGGEYKGSGGVNKEGIHYYRISEAAAFGGGMLYQSKVSENNAFFMAVHVNAILLGGSLTDYYNDIDRDYNLGSGYSNKLKAGMLFKSKMELALNFENYHIFTWKGYDPDIDLSQLSYEDQLYLNAQGDKGNARLSLLTLSFNYKINKHLDLYTDLSYYYRKSKYVYHDNISYSVGEAKIGLGYLF
ncbi:MAG: hypothetical protein LBV74_00505 [Tannerella sp.]|jgi:hypothetical protein|nr:hypothetical protein [Tannerella sp.]